MTRQELADYIRNAYGTEADHPFPGDVDSCVFRHAGNHRWFALVMRVPYRTLGMEREGAADILNVKCDPVLIGSLRGKAGFHPAYHMNKDKWITVRLDGSADREEIEALVDISYTLTADRNGKRGKQREGI